MPTFFRIIDTHTRLLSKPAPLNAKELAALRVTLQNAGIHADVDNGEIDGIALNFEYNANAIAIAHFARTFDHRLDIIAIIEEAQFLGRAIRVQRASKDAFATLLVSEHIALSPEIAVSYKQAEQVFTCLKLDRTKTQSVPFERLRSLLRDPSTCDSFDRGGLTYFLEYLARLSNTDCGEQYPELAWV